jgi:hypothetical protein
MTVGGMTYTSTTRDFGLLAGLPVRVHLVEGILRFDTGGHATIDFGRLRPDGTSATDVGLSIPIAFTFNATPNLYFGLGTGLTIGRLDTADATAAIPAGIGAGFTIPKPRASSAPLADLYAAFDLPLLLQPGADAVVADLYVLRLGLALYIGGR